jgi:ABC-type transport system substrate-binding protein
MLKTGEADITRVGRERLKEVVDAGLNVVSKENAAHVMYQGSMQWTSPAFSDIRFRKALNLAIDKEAIIKHIFAGSARSTTSYPGAVIRAVRGIPALKPYPYDPEQARRLIKEAGYDGFEFNLASYVRPGCPELPRLAETICGYWEKIGLKPKIVTMEFTAWRARDMAQKTQGFIYGADSNEGPEVSEILTRYRRWFYSTEPRGIVKDPKLDDMINRAEKSLSLAEVEKIIGDIYRYAYDQYIFIPICDISDEIATTKRIPLWDPGLRRADRNYNDIIRQL